MNFDPKTFCARLRQLLFVGFICSIVCGAKAALWCTGYLPGLKQSALPAANVDFTTITHIIHFSVIPNSDGTLNSTANGITPANSSNLISRAHVVGRKALICVGGAGSESVFQSATSPARLSSFINNLTNFVASRGYDGVDLDWEPLTVGDAQQFTNLVYGLRSSLNGFKQPQFLTAAASAYPPYGDPPAGEYVMYAALQSQFDQINIMTYDLSGPYSGWVTWFNSPIYDGGFRFPSSGGLVPSVDGAVKNFLVNGVASEKLGIGVAFYGYMWRGGSGTPTGGVSQPRQSWTSAPSVATYPFNTIMGNYYQTNSYRWDTNAQSAYLGITNSNSANDMFVSYDDQRTCQSKVSYARNHHLGGIMIWELTQDHQSGQPDPLLGAIKLALATPGQAQIRLNGQKVDLSFSGLPLGSYGILLTSDLGTDAWGTLTTTNDSGAGGMLRLADPDSATSPQRFYRVQTPP